MSPGMDASPKTSSAILFQNEAKTVVCLDIPRTIEESQTLPGETTDRRLFSTEPISAPFPTPETKNAAAHALGGSTPAAQISELMTAAVAESALRELKEKYSGPFCLPRLTRESPGEALDLHDPAGLYIPQDSNYLCGSVGALKEEFTDKAPKFDLIVMDPPWPNRSATRKRGYSTCRGLEEMRELLSLIPVQRHLAPGGLVALWITNRAKIRELLTSKDGVLADWGLDCVGEWTWLKVASSGDPIVGLDSNWRKPWEQLLIAQRKGRPHLDIIDQRVLVGVPDMHSRKPNLRGLFHDILDPGYSGLEIFARHLTAGWWSWGDEVTMFQQEGNWAVRTELDERQQMDT